MMAKVWKEEGCRALKDLGVVLTKYRHTTYGTKVVLGKVEGPICRAGLMLSTGCENNRGLPHCLEHLCFVETKRHPRGLLDLLATRNGSDGTNAFTSDDQTQYELDVVGEQGLLSVIPVFINHILAPNLTPESFLTEVFNINGKGERQGVVYSEMAGRVNSEDDLMWHKFDSMIFGEGTPYSYASGGIPDDIAKLTREEIMEYHKKVYSTDNLSVVVFGDFSHEKFLNTVAEALKQAVEEDGAPIVCQKKFFSEKLPDPAAGSSNKRAVVAFPSDDTTCGTFIYGAKLPFTLADAEKLVAVQVIFRYLTSLSSSPLNQAFVELENPIASEVDGSVHHSCDPYFTLHFGSVPFDEELNKNLDATATDFASDDENGEADQAMQDASAAENDEDTRKRKSPEEENWFESSRLLDKLIAELRKALTGLREGKDHWEALQAALSKEELDGQAGYEQSPHETLLCAIAPELIFDAYPTVKDIEFGLLVDDQLAYRQLKSHDKEWWAALMDECIVKPLIVTREGGQGACEVRTVPSKALQKKNEKAAKAVTKANMKKFGPAKLAKFQQIVQAAEKRNTPVITDAMKASFPPAVTLTGVNDKPHTISWNALGDAERCVESFEIGMQTSFVECKAYFDLSHLDVATRRYIYLFTELFYESDIGDMHFTDVAKQIDEDFVSSSCQNGKTCHFMQPGILPTCVSVSLTAVPDKADRIAHWLGLGLRDTKFTREKLMTTCKTMLSDIAEECRQGSSVLGFASTLALHTGDAQGCLSGPFSQRPFLKRCLKDIDETIKHLDLIKAALLDTSTPVSFVVGGKDGATRKAVVDAVDKTLRLAAAPSPRPALLSKAAWGAGTADKLWQAPFKGFAIGVGGVDTAYIRITRPLELIDEAGPAAMKEKLALSLLCECINLHEGELSQSVRGRGLAYGAGVYFRSWSQVLTIDVWECTNVQTCLDGVLDTLRSVPDNESTVLTDFSIQTALGSEAHGYASDRSTPSSILSTTVEELLRKRFTPEEARQAYEGLYKLTKQDLVDVYTKHLLPLLSSSVEGPIMAGIVCDPQSLVKANTALSSAFGVPVRTFSSLSEIYTLADTVIGQYTK
ncbi:hypothetical protein DIPPA_10554 [Diplonema papillatum]|nr:hypothetical protein DIPPA_10554 [Diplonema papillatum]